MSRPLNEDAIQRLLSETKQELKEFEQANMGRNRRLAEIGNHKSDAQERHRQEVDALQGRKDAQERMCEEGIISEQDKDEALRDIDDELKGVRDAHEEMIGDLDEEIEEVVEAFNGDAEKIRRLRGTIQEYQRMLDAIDATHDDGDGGEQMGADNEPVDVIEASA